LEEEEEEEEEEGQKLGLARINALHLDGNGDPSPAFDNEARNATVKSSSILKETSSGQWKVDFPADAFRQTRRHLSQ